MNNNTLNGRKYIDLNELRKVQLNILVYIDRFCKENNINYWIDCGTLLGAIRHKGYIPWDDDIDIGMLREDYDKFIELFNKNNNSQYRLHCYENDYDWNSTFGKVLDTNTVLYEPDEKTGIKMSVFVDVFVYDNAPIEKNRQKNMFFWRDVYRKLNSVRVNKKYGDEAKQKYNYIRYPLYYALKVFPKNYFLKKTIENSKKYIKIDTNLVGNFTSATKMVCRKDVFSSYVEVEFEGKKFKAPIGYKQWLTEFYGDYMKLPPKEKQISHHKFVAYYK